MALNRTIYRTFEILDLLEESETGLSLKELSEKMDIPKTSVFDIVHTLLDIGVVEKPNEYVKKYVVGKKLFSMGQTYMTKKDINKVDQSYIKDLANKLNKTVYIGVEYNAEIVYIQACEPARSIKSSSLVGSTEGIYSTALGKAYLANCTSEKQKEIIEQIEFVKYQKNTITSKESLLAELERTKKRGFAIDNEENEEGVICFGAPIFNKDGKVVASMSVSGFNNEIKNLGVELQEILKTSRIISDALK